MEPTIKARAYLVTICILSALSIVILIGLNIVGLFILFHIPAGYDPAPLINAGINRSLLFFALAIIKEFAALQITEIDKLLAEKRKQGSSDNERNGKQ
ncbi:hypothetical protein HGA64_05540 [Candidatus Falkowbacteria bacterium]|nr:hypothetical protein [Candidatus Falkowbacteria bacterium]